MDSHERSGADPAESAASSSQQHGIFLRALEVQTRGSSDSAEGSGRKGEGGKALGQDRIE